MPGPHANKKAMLATGRPKELRRVVKRLFSYLEKDRAKLVLVFFCVLISALSSLAGSYMLRPIINMLVSPEGSVKALAEGVAVMLMIYAAGIATQYLQARIMVQVAQDALQKLRNDLFCRLQRLPVSFHDTNRTGDLMSRFTNDVDAIGEMLTSTIVQILSGAISIVGTLALMLYTNIYLTVITVVMVPLMMKAGQTVANRSRKYYQRQQASLGALNGYIEETVSGQKVVKVFCH